MMEPGFQKIQVFFFSQYDFYAYLKYFVQNQRSAVINNVIFGISIFKAFSFIDSAKDTLSSIINGSSKIYITQL